MKQSRFIYISLSIIMFIISIYLVYVNEISYAVIAAIAFLFFMILSIKNLRDSKDPYNAQVKKILRSYDSILVEVDKFTNLSDKKIIRVKYFKDMVNVEYEFRKPIYYIKNEDCIDFALVNSEDSYVYILKKSEEIKSPLEQYLDTRKEIDEQEANEFDLLNELDKTTVIKINELKEYKVTPIKDKKEDSNKQNNVIVNENETKVD